MSIQDDVSENKWRNPKDFKQKAPRMAHANGQNGDDDSKKCDEASWSGDVHWPIAVEITSILSHDHCSMTSHRSIRQKPQASSDKLEIEKILAAEERKKEILRISIAHICLEIIAFHLKNRHKSYS